MSEKALSQQEIDDLMVALAIEQEEPVGVDPGLQLVSKSVKYYDFRRPDKFSKEHLRALRVLHGAFAKTLAGALTSYVRSHVQVRLTTVEQVAYEEYIRSLPSMTVVYIVSLAPLPGQIVLELEPVVARAIIDRLLGGTGAVNMKPREMTEIELALLKTLGAFLAKHLCDTWAGVIVMEPSVQDPVLSPELVQVTLAAETTVVLTHEITLLKTIGTLSICMPHPVLQLVMDKIKAQAWVNSSPLAVTEDGRMHPQDLLSQVALPIVVELGRSEISVHDLLTMVPGQVLRLDTAANADLPVLIGEHVKFEGRPGLLGRNIAVQISRTRG